MDYWYISKLPPPLIDNFEPPLAQPSLYNVECLFNPFH